MFTHSAITSTLQKSLFFWIRDQYFFVIRLFQWGTLLDKSPLQARISMTISLYLNHRDVKSRQKDVTTFASE